MGPGSLVGPAFVTVTVYVPVLPVVKLPVCDFTILRSTKAGTLTSSRAVLSGWKSSVISDSAVAVLVTDGYAEARTLAVTVYSA